MNSGERYISVEANPSHSTAAGAVLSSAVTENTRHTGHTGSVTIFAGSMDSSTSESSKGTLNRQDHICRLQEALDGIERCNHFKSVGGDAVAHEWEDQCWGVFYDPDGKPDYVLTLFFFFWETVKRG